MSFTASRRVPRYTHNSILGPEIAEVEIFQSCTSYPCRIHGDMDDNIQCGFHGKFDLTEWDIHTVSFSI